MNDATQYMMGEVEHDNITDDWVMEGVEISLSGGNPFLGLSQDDWMALAAQAFESDMPSFIRAIKSSPIAQRQLTKEAVSIVNKADIEQWDDWGILHDAGPFEFEGFRRGE